MIVRSPAEFYIKYLVTHPSGYNTAAIRRRLKKYRLADLGDAYIDEIREDLFVPSPFRPKIKSHTDSQDFLIEEAIFGLWHQDEHTKMAMSVLNHAQAQEIIESLVLAGATDASIPPLLSRRFDLDFTREAISRYRHYFWNTPLCNRNELRTLCYQEALKGSSDLNLSVSDRKAILKASYMNPRVLAAELPTSPISVAMVEGLLGFVPTHMDAYKAARLSYDYVLRRIAEVCMRGGPNAASQARDWGIAMEKLGIQMETMATPEDDLKVMMKTISLETEVIQTPTIHQLTGGKFSDGSYMEPEEEEQKVKR